MQFIPKQTFTHHGSFGVYERRFLSIGGGVTGSRHYSAVYVRIHLDPPRRGGGWIVWQAFLRAITLEDVF